MGTPRGLQLGGIGPIHLDLRLPPPVNLCLTMYVNNLKIWLKWAEVDPVFRTLETGFLKS